MRYCFASYMFDVCFEKYSLYDTALQLYTVFIDTFPSLLIPIFPSVVDVFMTYTGSKQAIHRLFIISVKRLVTGPS